jgi:hypothetical protein
MLIYCPRCHKYYERWPLYDQPGKSRDERITNPQRAELAYTTVCTYCQQKEDENGNVYQTV